MAAAEIAVDVVYALPAEQVVVRVVLAQGATVADAIRQSGLMLRYPQLDGATRSVGVFGKRVDEQAVLSAGDRVEIYRSLTVEPKEARRRRVELRTSKPRSGSRRGPQ